MTLPYLQTQALVAAIIGTDAEKAMQRYLDSAVPLSRDFKRKQERVQERLLKTIENLDPISLKNVHLGVPVGDTLPSIQTSMFKRSNS